MNRYLVDANVLLRWLDSSDPQHAIAKNAIDTLDEQGHDLHITAQNVIEFWAVASRPLHNNGFGWDVARCYSSVSLLLKSFEYSPDTAAIFDEWQRLVAKHSVTSLHVHDTRLVAVIKTHNLDGILTFNEKHFRRFEANENIVVLEPAAVNQ